MLSTNDMDAICRLARQYGLKRVLLFGSAARADRAPRDIDLAVEGLAPERFFAFYGELLFALTLPVDLIDLSHPSRFADLVRQEGILVYG